MKLVEVLHDVEDPRQQGKVKHSLVNILFISICAVFNSADTWEDIHMYAKFRRKWLSTYIDMSTGIPSSDTFRRVFGLICPTQISELTHTIISKFFTKENQHICLDGKTMRSNKSKEKGIKPVQIVSAWSETFGLCLGEVSVDKKSNEITAIPVLLDMLDIKGCTISMDAMGTQKDIVEQIVDKKAHYVLALKGNQGKFFESVKTYMHEHGEKPTNLICDYFDDSHGRCVRRRYFAVDIPEAINKINEFKNLKTIIATENISTRSSDSPVTSEWRYFITDHSKDDAKLADYVRGHWGVENKLHWHLDVHLGDDKDKKLDRNGTENISRIKRLLLNLVRKNDINSKTSVRSKLKRMLWDEEYFLKILST